MHLDCGTRGIRQDDPAGAGVPAFHGARQPALWLECNENDGEPSHFLNSLYAAASSAGVNTPDPEFNSADFGRRAASLGANVCLCIDGLEHVIATDTEPLVERLLGSLPPRARVLLASRRLPNAWFLERELQGLALTIEANELRLTRSELAKLLPEPFTAGQIATVSALTEGWPVAAQLTRLRARDRPSIAEMLERLAHEGLGLFEYLAHKVLEGLSAEQRELLRVTSILSAITPGLANALLRRDDGYALLSGVLRLAPIVSVTSDRDSHDSFASPAQAIHARRAGPHRGRSTSGPYIGRRLARSPRRGRSSKPCNMRWRLTICHWRWRSLIGRAAMS